MLNNRSIAAIVILLLALGSQAHAALADRSTDNAADHTKLYFEFNHCGVWGQTSRIISNAIQLAETRGDAGASDAKSPETLVWSRYIRALSP